MLILLLPFLALLHSSRPATGFNATRCDKEMACFIPESCAGLTSSDFTRSKLERQVDACECVVAIRAYSLTKWLVVMRGNRLAAQGIKLSVSVVGGQSPQPMFECKPNGDKAAIAVGSDMTKGTEYSSYFNKTEKVVLCEFEVERAVDFAEWSGKRLESSARLALAYETKTLHMKPGGFFDATDPSEGCDPVDIQFEPTTSDAERYEKVDAHRFAVACREGWTLSAKWEDGAVNYTAVTALECRAKDGKHMYMVDTKSEGGTRNTAQDLKKLFARCTQKRCLACAAVPCGKAGCPATNFTAAVGDTCAKLECEGNRFEIAVGSGEEWRASEGTAPICTDGHWALAGTQFTTARCFKACPPLKCDGCTDSSSGVEATCEEGSELSISNAATGKDRRVARLDCDTATGSWTGGDVNKDDVVACAIVGQLTPAQALAAKSKLNVILGSCLLGFSALGALLCGCIGMRIRQRRKLARGSASSVTTTGTGNMSRKSKHHHHSTSGGSSNSGNSKESTSLGEHKAEKAPLIPPEAPAKRGQEERREEKTQPPAEPVASSKDPTSTPPPPPPATKKVDSNPPDDDDHGYVVIDPANYPSAPPEAAKTAAAAAPSPAPPLESNYVLPEK